MAASLGMYTGLRRTATCDVTPQPQQPATRGLCPTRRGLTIVVAATRPKKADTSDAPPAAPKPRPAVQVPEGTPKGVSMDMPVRPRRNRRSPTVRAAFREVRLLSCTSLFL